jgi:hypothetical protein
MFPTIPGPYLPSFEDEIHCPPTTESNNTRKPRPLIEFIVRVYVDVLTTLCLGLALSYFDMPEAFETVIYFMGSVVSIFKQTR